jgi:outer membrane protein
MFDNPYSAQKTTNASHKHERFTFMRTRLVPIVFSLIPSLACADTVFGVYGGVGQWYLDMEGEVGQYGVHAALDKLGLQSEVVDQVWGKIEHPIPFLPNIGAAHNQLSTTVLSTTGQQIGIGNIRIDVQVDIQTEMNLSLDDVTFYYELLDNTVSFDVGVTARRLSGYVKIIPEVGDVFRANLEGVVPLAYVSARMDFPFSGFHIGAAANGISYGEDKISDIATEIGYEFEVFSVLDVGLSIGYRSMTLLSKELSALYADAKFTGSYANLTVHF